MKRSFEYRSDDMCAPNQSKSVYTGCFLSALTRADEPEELSAILVRIVVSRRGVVTLFDVSSAEIDRLVQLVPAGAHDRLASLVMVLLLALALLCLEKAVLVPQRTGRLVRAALSGQVPGLAAYEAVVVRARGAVDVPASALVLADDLAGRATLPPFFLGELERLQVLRIALVDRQSLVLVARHVRVPFRLAARAHDAVATRTNPARVVLVIIVDVDQSFGTVLVRAVQGRQVVEESPEVLRFSG